jgi:hypothetical protein
MTFMTLSQTVLSRANGATIAAHDHLQMSLDFEVLPTKDEEDPDERLALCRWEDDGGAIGRVEVYGE